MPTFLQVVAKKPTSLRDAILRDLDKQREPWLEVIQEKKPGRPKGWSKLRANERAGVINLSWDAPSRILTCRAVTRQGNRSAHLVGDFVAYLLERHAKRIAAINLQVR